MVSLRVSVRVTTLWTSPNSPRPIDAPAVSDDPDPVGWLAALDAHPDDDETGHGRLGLHGRIDSQAMLGEPVLPIGPVTDDGWVQVVLPWQPSRLDPRGYPGWLRRAHLDAVVEDHDGVTITEGLPVRDAPDGAEILDVAREHRGLAYLWGGMSPLGLDCSGLVHLVWRRLGVIVPRDADDQEAAAYRVGWGEERPGDLYFFAHPGRPVHHVGIVTAPGRMLHAPETGRGIIEEALGPDREATRYAVGRLPLTAPRPLPGRPAT